MTDMTALDFTVEQVADDWEERQIVAAHGETRYNYCIQESPARVRTAGATSQDGENVMTTPIIPVSPETPQLKRCSKCDELKPRESFGRCAKLKGGLRSWCRECEKAASKARDRSTDKAWRDANPGKSAEYSRRWREKNPEKIKELNAKAYAADLEYSRARSKKWREKNRDRARKQQREYMRKYRAEQPDKVRASMASIRAKRANAPGSYTDEDIEAIRIAQDNRCYICRRKLTKYHIDHFVPLALGGSNDPGNMRLACPKCNMSKGAKHPHDMGILI